MRTRRITAKTTCVCLVLASMAAGQESDDPIKPGRFRSLIAVKQTVLLKTSTNSQLTIQLLSDEQLKRLESKDAEQAEMMQRLGSIDKLLKQDQGLENLAALLKERQELQSNQSRSAMSQRMVGTRYLVTHVGEDYVALSRGGSERFVPFASIRYMYRSETLESTIRFPAGRGRSSRGASSAAQSTRIRLDNAKATELVKVIKKLYSDIDLKITVESDGNTLSLESEDAQLRPIEQLIKSLDERVVDPKIKL